jgi:tannase/feruloyl esterase
VRSGLSNSMLGMFAVLSISTALYALYDATDPDLSRYAEAGGKLILWHGWADPHISPLNTIAYYSAMQKLLGDARTANFSRLYLFPGGNHCGGGEGPFEVDLLSAIMAWVERGHAPYALIASHSDESGGHRGGTRPVYPYPTIARYEGKGNMNDARSWVASKPISTRADTFDWLGSSFFRAHYEKWCSGHGTRMPRHGIGFYTIDPY